MSLTGSLGHVSAIDSSGRTRWIADAHRDGKRFIVSPDEKLLRFLELERITLGKPRNRLQNAVYL
jgi:hypothetical protein